MRSLVAVVLTVAVVMVGLGYLPAGVSLAYPAYGVYLPAIMKGGSGGTPPTPTATSVSPVPTATATSIPPATPTATVVPPIPTATSTATATATVAPCNEAWQVLSNTSFETGWYPWTTTGLAERTQNMASQGAWSVWFGGYENANDGIAYEFTTWPKMETAAVYFDWRMYSDEGTTQPYDFLFAGIYDTSLHNYVATTFVDNTNVRGAWRTTRLELPNAVNFRYKTMAVVLLASTDAMYSTAWFVDNVRLYFACGGWTAGPQGATPERRF